MGKNGNVGNENSGRKTDAEIVRHYIDTGLANSIGNQELKRIEQTPIVKRKREDLEKIVMPIVLKDMVDKKEVNEKIELLGEAQKLIAKTLNGEANGEANE